MSEGGVFSKIKWSTGDVYEGEFRNGKMTGKGYVFDKYGGQIFPSLIWKFIKKKKLFLFYLIFFNSAEKNSRFEYLFFLLMLFFFKSLVHKVYAYKSHFFMQGAEIF